jgi:hypothetical protein
VPDLTIPAVTEQRARRLPVAFLVGAAVGLLGGLIGLGGAEFGFPCSSGCSVSSPLRQ